MTLDLSQTIVAVSSGLAAGRRAIVRISGSETKLILYRLLASPSLDAVDVSPEATAFLESRRASFWRGPCSINLATDAVDASAEMPRRIPVCYYWWPDHRSFTGESSAEIHIVGSLPLVESLVETIVSHGARLAERGEFTLRSFLAGKVDLTQAEAVLGVIEAENEGELHEALAQLGGNISRPVRDLRDQLLELTAHLEAGLDFVEEDIQFISNKELLSQLGRIDSQLKAIASQLESRGLRSRTINVVLVGLPNAGKSSLFNVLAGMERAIVSEAAGTTRDAVTQHIRLRDLFIDLTDTAGIEELQEDSPRALAQSVLAERLDAADAVLFCVDLSGSYDAAWVRNHWRLLSQKAPTLLVGTKQDLAPASTPLTMDAMVSAHDLPSIERLKKMLHHLLEGNRHHLKSQALHDTMLRCKRSLDLAIESLARAIQIAVDEMGEELAAAELRAAIDDLSSIIGEVHTEDILGQIFSRFCIGK